MRCVFASLLYHRRRSKHQLSLENRCLTDPGPVSFIQPSNDKESFVKCKLCDKLACTGVNNPTNHVMSVMRFM